MVSECKHANWSGLNMLSISRTFRNSLPWIGGAVAVAAISIGSVKISQAQNSGVKIDGSSTVFPISEAVAEDFREKSGTRVTVGVSGTGGGFKKFCRGEIDIVNASRPILAKEMSSCKAAGIQYVELPIAYDALTIVINPQNTWAGSLTTADLKTMWSPTSQGKVTNWSQVKTGFPNAPLKLYGPGANSGTFDYFTEAINGKSKASRGDYTASEDDNVLVQGVTRDKNAIGYFGYAYYEANKNKLKAVKINGVSPSPTTVKSGQYRPLSRPLFIYVSSKSIGKPEVQSFVNYYISNAGRLSSAVKYIPLPAKAYSLISGHFKTKRFGTVFGGDEAVGLTIEQLISREAKQ
jgi:phosphate transport system substrate-binding protein